MDLEFERELPLLPHEQLAPTPPQTSTALYAQWWQAPMSAPYSLAAQCGSEMMARQAL